MNESYWLTTAAGLALGFGFASVMYLAIFTRTLRQLHKDNVVAASLLVKGDAATAELLVEGDKNRATDVAQTASDLTEADQTVTRKVKAEE